MLISTMKTNPKLRMYLDEINRLDNIIDTELEKSIVNGAKYKRNRVLKLIKNELKMKELI